jgi:hypothetical protein
LELKQKNVLENLKNKWWPPCEITNKEDSYGSITIDMVGGAFIMLAVGIALALVVLCIQTMTLRSFGNGKTTVIEIESDKYKSSNIDLKENVSFFWRK